MEGVDHKKWMTRAIKLSEQSSFKGDEPFGAVAVWFPNGSKWVADAIDAKNKVNTKNDPTRHAEMVLCNNWSDTGIKASECIFYSSTEPCMMCTGAIYRTGFRRIVYGTSKEEMREIINQAKTDNGFEVTKKDKFLSIHELCKEVKGMQIIGGVSKTSAGVIHSQHWNQHYSKCCECSKPPSEKCKECKKVVCKYCIVSRHVC